MRQLKNTGKSELERAPKQRERRVRERWQETQVHEIEREGANVTNTESSKTDCCDVRAGSRYYKKGRDCMISTTTTTATCSNATSVFPPVRQLVRLKVGYALTTGRGGVVVHARVRVKFTLTPETLLTK